MTVIDKDNILLNVELHAIKGNRLVLVIAANAVQFWLTSDKDATTGIKVDEAPVVTVEGARRIGVGDVSGDRIDDIVLVSDKGIQVFRGEPRLK
jgi:hypothetical protein